MSGMIMFVAIIILMCVMANRFAGKVGMPVLVTFIALGMFFGGGGPLGLHYHNFQFTEHACSAALIFIMFYGGFGTKWETARPVAFRAIILSSVGVLLTALGVMVFCHYVLGFQLKESFLVGAVLSSTDAASVFSILRFKNLSLRGGTDSLLEIESGSNDPMSYMLTVIAIALLTGEQISIGVMLFTQIALGLVCGAGIALFARWALCRSRLVSDGMQSVFVIAVALVSYAMPQLLGGNGYLSVYITGIILGNSTIRHKDVLVPFFDGITMLAQMLIFFLLGLLSDASTLGNTLLPALAITLFLLVLGRPLVILLLMLPFGRGLRENALVSWAGLRGAASIVFAIMAVGALEGLSIDLFHIVFTVALVSVTLQGTLLPRVAKLLDMIDGNADVRKTFTDYQEESVLNMMRMHVHHGHPWAGKAMGEIPMAPDVLALMIKREGETVIPRGDTHILEGDDVILSVPAYEDVEMDIELREIVMVKGHAWVGLTIAELDLPESLRIAVIKRAQENIIPRGKTRIHEGDVVVVYNE